MRESLTDIVWQYFARRKAGWSRQVILWTYSASLNRTDFGPSLSMRARLEVDSKAVIVFNPLRSPARQNSDMAHELSHLLLRHELTEIREVAGLPFRTCRTDQKEEATTLMLGGTRACRAPLTSSPARRHGSQ